MLNNEIHRYEMYKNNFLKSIDFSSARVLLKSDALIIVDTSEMAEGQSPSRRRNYIAKNRIYTKTFGLPSNEVLIDGNVFGVNISMLNLN